MKNIKWEDQICGVHQTSYSLMIDAMPDLIVIEKTFPENVNDFIWDVKVHMLMPSQFPCIPNWHYENIPRINNKRDFSLV